MSRQEDAPVVAATTPEAQSEEGMSAASPQMIFDRVPVHRPVLVMDKYSSATPAQRRFARAVTWRMRNRDAWEYMVGLARERAEARTAFGMQELVEQVRRRDFTDSRGLPTRVNNTIVPALARILVDLHPECAPFIELRTRAYDGLGSHAGRE